MYVEELLGLEGKRKQAFRGSICTHNDKGNSLQNKTKQSKMKNITNKPYQH